MMLQRLRSLQSVPCLKHDESENKVDPVQLFEEAWSRWSRALPLKDRSHPSYDVIPRFYYGKDTSISRNAKPETKRLQEAFKVATREEHLARKTEQAVENSELELLWKTLVETDDGDVSESNNTWRNFRQLQESKRKIEQHTTKFNEFFSPRLLMCLRRNQQGHISLNDFFDLIMRRVSLSQTRLILCAYDQSGLGRLTENDLGGYIFDCIPEMAQLKSMNEGFYVTYAVYATRKFLFFLDERRLGYITLKKLLRSEIMAEFFEMQEDDLPEKYEQSNWFSLTYVSEIHGEYIELDVDKNGLLSKSEFTQINGGSVTRRFIDRLFQEGTTYSGEIDYKQYLDFVLACKNPRSEQSIKFMFRILDIDHTGYLTRNTISFFWQGILEHPLALDFDNIREEDLISEIFDMIGPEKPGVITLKDFLRSGTAHTICNMLSDVRGFLDYEQREVVPDTH
eukprot:m.25609 g.25609  ORF g.25609 m.25609 type:complete len:453 (-) comp7721_c0_seq1:139-1497(-)